MRRTKIGNITVTEDFVIFDWREDGWLWDDAEERLCLPHDLDINQKYWLMKSMPDLREKGMYEFDDVVYFITSNLCGDEIALLDKIVYAHWQGRFKKYGFD